MSSLRPIESGEPVVATLEQSGYDLAHIVVFGGTVMALKGLRAAGDVDIAVRATAFDESLAADPPQTPGSIRLQKEPVRQGRGEDLRIPKLFSRPGDQAPLGLHLLRKLDDEFEAWKARMQVTLHPSRIGDIACVSLAVIEESKRELWGRGHQRDRVLILDYLIEFEAEERSRIAR